MTEEEREELALALSIVSARLVAVHEAGHAVIAAYLDVPFIDVTAKRRENGGLNGSVRYDRESVQSHLADWCVVLMASRAAVDALLSQDEEVGRFISDLGPQVTDEWMERTYLLDEDELRTFGRSLYGLDSSSETFSAWRTEVSERAGAVVAIPHVWKAILTVSDRLMMRDALTSDEVHRILSEHKANT